MLVKRILPTLALGIVLCLGQSGPGNAITYGEPDNGAHGYVGLALFLSEGQIVTFCSGTLMSPSVFLTAAHCAAGSDTALVWFDDVVERDNPPVPILGLPIPHPAFDDFATFPNTSDVGVVLLEEDVWMATYGELPDLGVLDALSTRRGHQNRLFTVVGYGLELIRPFDPLVPPEFVTRRAAPSMLINLESALTDGYNLQTSGNPGQGMGTGGVCKGDSGGPVLLGDSNVVVGVISFGQNAICRGVGFHYRTDIDNTQDFLDGFLP
jgi:hypothetical protein